MYDDGGNDAIENMFYWIEFRIKDEIGKDANRIVHGGMVWLKIGNIDALQEYIHTYIKKVIRQGELLLSFVVIYKVAIMGYLEYKTYKYIIIYDRLC